MSCHETSFSSLSVVVARAVVVLLVCLALEGKHELAKQLK